MEKEIARNSLKLHTLFISGFILWLCFSCQDSKEGKKEKAQKDYTSCILISLIVSKDNPKYANLGTVYCTYNYRQARYKADEQFGFS